MEQATTGFQVDPTLAEQRLLRKALRDPIYGSAYPSLGSLQALLEAGFIDDGSDSDEPELYRAGDDWLMTPTKKIRDCLLSLTPEAVAQAKFLAVLLTTGAFCPIHPGHLMGMQIARAELQAQGAIVVGGYLAADHDGYVLPKCGKDGLEASYRLQLVEEAVRDSDWLMSDSWCALGVERALNFTDVIVRLESYLAAHVKTPRPLEVVYVFGGDNARFARTFVKRGRCVCVARPGSEATMASVAKEKLVADNDRIVFARKPSLAIASRMVREGQDGLMSVRPGEIYRRWMAQRSLDAASDGSGELPRKVYCLRNEGEWAISPWLTGRNRRQVNTAWNAYVQRLTALLVETHKNAHSPDARLDVEIRIQTLEQQRLRAAALTEGFKVISMDSCIPGEFNLAVSRHFPLSCSRHAPILGARPGHPDLQSQIATIEPGQYVLFDDDIATGFTMRYIRKLLPESIQIVKECALTRNRETGDGLPVLDILDCRDFLLGVREGGLVVELPDGTMARAPYGLPYVSPADRMSAPIGSEVQLARRLLESSELFFQSIQPAIRLQEADPAFRKLMHYVGFDDEDTIESICRWHIDNSILPTGGKLVLS